MTKTGKKVAHIAASWTADLPAGTGIIAARMIRRSTGPSPAESRQSRARLHLKAHSLQRREDAERELKAQYNRQAAYARRYVNKWPQATAHEYLTRKGIQAAPGVRINDKNELVIPFRNRNGAIRSYQRIPVTGGRMPAS